jgi:hypothetical protein
MAIHNRSTAHLDNSNNKIRQIRYEIAIPSYRRSQLIVTKTLATLKRHNIAAECITIFVANEDERAEYVAKVPAGMYGKIVIGCLGLKNQRNFITEYYEVGTNIVNMDDDIDDVQELDNATDVTVNVTDVVMTKKAKQRNKLRPIENLDKFIVDAFRMCKKNGIYLWGIYPVANAYFMTYKIRTNLQFIVGPFWGVINRHNAALSISMDEKENVERSLLYYKMDNAVLRFDNVTVVTKYYKTVGGMQSSTRKTKRTTNSITAAQLIHKRYPKWTKIKIRHNGRHEIVFVKTPNTIIVSA